MDRAKGWRWGWREASLAGTMMLVLQACGPDPDMPIVANSHEVVEGHPQEGALWPVLFQHCSRSRSCDPMSNFGEGEGEASGYARDASWFVETADQIPLDGAAFGPRILVTFNTLSEWGGSGGRPLMRHETPANVRAPIARQTWLSIEYRQSGEAPTPYFVTLRTAQLLVPLGEGPAQETRDERRARTAAEIAGWTWSTGGRGARVEVSTASGERIWGGYAPGFDARAHLSEEDSKKLGAEPWFFELAIGRTEDRATLEAVVDAIARGESLRLYVASPKGTMLTDIIATAGLQEAMRAAQRALADPSIAEPLTVRCLELLSAPAEVWEGDAVSPARRACDARTRDQRRAVPGYGVRSAG